MTISRKLIVEKPNYELEFLSEQTNRENEKRIYIKGQYIMMNRGNKNRRKYLEEDMIPAVDTYIKEYVEQNRGGGELNHSTSPDVDLSKLADKIISLERISYLFNSSQRLRILFLTTEGIEILFFELYC